MRRTTFVIFFAFLFSVAAHAGHITWVAPEIGVWTPVPNAGVPGSGIPAGTEMRVLEQTTTGAYTPVELVGSNTVDFEHSWTYTPGQPNAYGQVVQGSVVDTTLRIDFSQDINGHVFTAAFANFFRDTDGDPLVTITASGDTSPASLGMDYTNDPGYAAGAEFDTVVDGNMLTLVYNPAGDTVNNAHLFDRNTHGHHLKRFIVTTSGLRANDTHWIRFGFTDDPSNSFTPAIPEPSSLLLLFGAAIGLAMSCRRSRSIT